MHLDLMEILAAFMVLFAIIDILGSIPIILDVKAKTGNLLPGKTTTDCICNYAACFISSESPC